MGAPHANEGNFLELLKLLAEYDSVLEQHLKSPADSKVTYLSNRSQNDLIEALASETLSAIIQEVKTARFYSVIVDSSIDVARIDQFSLSLRYVTEKGDTVERFVKFEELPDSSAEAFYNLLIGALNDLGLNVNFLRGQAYDGARNMSGHISGLQARIKETCTDKAFYVHCCAHNLNLILLDAACSCNSAKLFFGTLESLYCFLTSSLPRFKILEEEQDNMKLDSTVLTLKSLSDTRWASRKQATEAVIQSFPAILKALDRIQNHSHTSPKAASDAQGLLSKMSTFEFKLMLLFWNSVLKKTYILSNYLQKESIDINAAVDLIDACIAQIKELRKDEAFDDIMGTAKRMAEESNGTIEFQEERVRKKKRYFEENVEDEPIQDARGRFKVEFYFYILDTILEKFKTRFSDFRQVASLFSVLNPKRFLLPDAEKKMQALARFYCDDLCDPEGAVDEFLSFCTMYSELSMDLDTDAVLPFLISNDMHNAYPQLTILHRIYRTIPITSASAERSFSRLKLIKNYLRSCMNEVRLSNLTLLCIERDMDIDRDKVIGRFANMKDRKMKL